MPGVAYSYVRFSTPEQVRGDSLRRQLSLSTSWCERNGFVLDDSLRLRDLGVSAWRGKNASQGRLGAFLRAVEEGQVQPGSVLLVESLDRLSRAQVGEALELFLGILRSGITIVTLSPEETFTRESVNDIVKLLVAIIIMGRAYEESQIKSQRIGAAWRAKRERIAERKLTAKAPAWLRLSEDRKEFHLVPGKAEVVRRVFDLAIGGHGVVAIAKRLNRDGVPPLGSAKLWGRSSIIKILSDRQAIGEYQPHSGHGSRERRPIGDPIPDYYPPVIDLATYHRAMQAMSGRKTKRGPVGEKVANLFTGLLRDARDGATLVLVDKGTKSAGPAVISSAAARGAGESHYISFPYDALESGILGMVTELTTADLTGQSEPDQLASQIVAAEGKLAELEAKVRAVRQRVRESVKVEPLLDLLQELDSERDLLKAEVERLKGEQRASTDNALGGVQDLCDLLAATPDGQELIDLRSRLRARLHDLVETIWVLVQVDESHAWLRRAAARVILRRGGAKSVLVYTERGRLRCSSGLAPDPHEGDPRQILLDFYGGGLTGRGFADDIRAFSGMVEE